MIDVSIVVPFHNSERYLMECIEGLLSQDYPRERYEIVMVDNNSTDASVRIVKRYPRVRLISEGRRGAYAARNRGVREAKGKIIAFTDSDCVPFKDWLQGIKEAMAHPEVGIVIGSLRFARDSFLLSLLADYENEKDHYVFTSKIKELYYGYAGNMAIRKELFAEIGPFVERIRGSDTIFIHQCMAKYSCEVVHYSPQIRVRHLEIDGVGKHFQKVFIYGKSSQKYRKIVAARPLTQRERFLVFWRTVRNRDYSWLKAMVLLGLLVVGFGYWVLGSRNLIQNFKQRGMILRLRKLRRNWHKKRKMTTEGG
ncbi:MAG TPA: glycosyltransferase [Candidatus Limnocylindrales bacterium]|nr:glycosyltransferase [Candidatus Limnocylindrales bacterium]